MTEERLNVEEAQNLLEAVGWDLHAAIDTLFGENAGAPATVAPVGLSPGMPAGDFMDAGARDAMFAAAAAGDLGHGDPGRGLAGFDAAVPFEHVPMSDEAAAA